jgi:excinuclease ABC subunit B
VDPQVEVYPADSQVDHLLGEINKTILMENRVLVTTLTKRMAEDLTDYLTENGIKVKYLHSDIDTVERVEIIRDLRLKEFDVLVGINLLREGLDIPEVGLVAVLDADKEGFLRSERSLIQTAGRAARNLDGRVIFYANSETRSMKSAMQEMARRREKQIEYNKINNITPEGIKKKIKDIIEQELDTESFKLSQNDKRKYRKYEDMTEPQLIKEIGKLEKSMQKMSRNLEFEKAAEVRDEIKFLKVRIYGPNLKDHVA